MKKILVLCLSVCLLFACSPTAEQIQKAIEQTQSADLNLPNPSGPTSTNVPKATRTPKPSNTPRPTNTSTTAPTKTPAPEPITLSGSGDDIVDFVKWEGAAIGIFTNSGSSNFIVKSFDQAGEYVDLLINTIGSYQGTVPIDFSSDEQTSRLEIKSSGSWEVQILPIDYARTETVPGIITGNTDDVVILTGEDPDLVKATSTGKSNFIVISYSPSDRDLIFNEISPYSGTAMLDSSTILLTISAEGDWSLEVTAR